MVDFQYGFSGFLPKPYGLKQLKHTLDEVILGLVDIEKMTVLVATKDGHFKERALDCYKNALLKMLDNSFHLLLFNPDLEEIDGVGSAK